MSDKKTVTLENAAPPYLGCHAVRANGYCFCPVVTAPFGAETRAGRGDSFLAQFPRGAAAAESGDVLQLTQDSLKALGSSLALGTKIEQFTTHGGAAAPYLEVRATFMETATRPASTNIQVTGLVNPNAYIGVQLIAAGGGEKQPIVVPGMPASPGPPFKPAPHAIVHGDFVFITGQVSFDFDQGYPAEAEIDTTSWYQSKAIAEARYILKKLKRILEHLGGSLQDCVKLEVYLNDLEDVVDLEKVMREGFGDQPPARAYIPTVRLGPTHCRVEIAAICRRPGSGQAITRIEGDAAAGSWLAPAALEYGGFLFTSSLCGNMPDRLDVSVPLADQVQRMFDRLGRLPPLRGSDLANVLFAPMQIASGTDLGALRWHAQQVKGVEQMAISPVVVSSPLLWTQAAIQTDFICAL